MNDQLQRAFGDSRRFVYIDEIGDDQYSKATKLTACSESVRIGYYWKANKIDLTQL